MNFVLVACVIVLLAVLGFFVVRRYVISEEDCEGPIGTLVAPCMLAVYLIAVAMAIVIGWENNSGAQDLRVREASAATDLYWSTGTLPDAAGEEVRTAVRGYVEAVIDDDWPLMREGDLSETAEQRLTELRMSVAQIPASDQASALDRMRAHQETAELIELRIERASTAGPNIPQALLLAALVSAVAVIAMPFAMGVRSRTRVFWAVANLVFVTGGVIVLFFIDNPYAGLLALDPDGLADALANFDRIDRVMTGV